MVSMTYGELPNRALFDAAFDDVCADTGKFQVRNCKRVGNVSYTADQLWEQLTDCIEGFEDGDEEAGNWASCVLADLGFEWI